MLHRGRQVLLWYMLIPEQSEVPKCIAETPLIQLSGTSTRVRVYVYRAGPVFVPNNGTRVPAFFYSRFCPFQVGFRYGYALPGRTAVPEPNAEDVRVYGELLVRVLHRAGHRYAVLIFPPLSVSSHAIKIRQHFARCQLIPAVSLGKLRLVSTPTYRRPTRCPSAVLRLHGPNVVTARVYR